MTDSSDSSFDISSDLKHKIIIIVWVGTATFAMVKLALDKKCSRRVQTPPHTSLDGSRKSDPAATARLLHQLENCSRPYSYMSKHATLSRASKDKEEDNDIESGLRENDGNNSHGLYSNACAICLDEYEEGDSLVLNSAAKECPHGFHHECMKEVVTTQARKGNYSISCPCCRQTFVETELEDRIESGH